MPADFATQRRPAGLNGSAPRAAVLVVVVLFAAGGCASQDPTAYDENSFEAASNANPIDRGTEFLRQIRNAEIQQQKADEGEKKTPRLFKGQIDTQTGEDGL